MGSSDWTRIQLWGLTPYVGNIWNNIHIQSDFQPFNFETSDAAGRQGQYKGGTDDCFYHVAEHMYKSAFFQTEFAVSEIPWNPAYPSIGNFGIGISPNKTGALCAVIKIGGKVFFVWNKTDEEFVERDMHVAGPSGKPDCRFYGRQPIPYGSRVDGWDSWNNESSTGRKLTSLMVDKFADCKKPTDQGMARDIPDPDQEFVAVWITNNAGAGNVLLEMPVYIIGSSTY
jgi:hypothetical protein